MPEVIFNQPEASIERIILQIESLVIQTGVTVMQALQEVLREPLEQEIASEKESLRQLLNNIFNQSVYK